MPEGIFVLYLKGVPLKLTRKNLMCAVKSGMTTVTYTKESRETGKKDSIQALTFSDVYLGHQGRALCGLQFYGNSLKDVIAHILYHVQHFITVLPEGPKDSSYGLQVCFTDTLNREVVKQHLKPILGDVYINKYFRRSRTQAIWAEMPLPNFEKSKL